MLLFVNKNDAFVNENVYFFGIGGSFQAAGLYRKLRKKLDRQK
jgi:hypothetical protein